MKAISLLVPNMPDTDAMLPYLRRIDAARWYTNFGPLVGELEQALAKELGASKAQVVAVANCTLGLELSLVGLGLQPGSRVLIPALTFVATAAAVLRAGLVPILADVNKFSWLLTPEIARGALERHNVGCVLPVATFGCPHPALGWDDFVRDTGVPVVIDAAGAFGNQQVGDLASVVFSFHATKSFGMGEGGLVAGRGSGHLARVRQMSNFGIDISLGISTIFGTNAKLSEYHAAVGLAALDRWTDIQVRRKLLLKRFVKALQDMCPDVTLQDRPMNGVYTILQVLLPHGAANAEIASRLRGRGIETRCWYLPPLTEHPAFSVSVRDGELSTLREIAPRMLGLPFHLELEIDDIERVCRELSEALLPSPGT